MKKSAVFLSLLIIAANAFAQNKLKSIWFDDLPIQTFSEGIRPVSAKSNYSHNTMSMNGVAYEHGLGAQSPCVLVFLLNKKATHFTALVGADDMGNKDIALKFYVVADQKVLFETKPMRIGDAPIKVDLNLTGVKQLGLLVTDTVGGVGNKKTYANWANASIEMMGDAMPEHTQN